MISSLTHYRLLHGPNVCVHVRSSDRVTLGYLTDKMSGFWNSHKEILSGVWSQDRKKNQKGNKAHSFNDEWSQVKRSEHTLMRELHL